MANFDDVYYCGKCNRQQQPSSGEKCVGCGGPTTVWNLAAESHKQADKTYGHQYRTPAKPHTPPKKKR